MISTKLPMCTPSRQVGARAAARERADACRILPHARRPGRSARHYGRRPGVSTCASGRRADAHAVAEPTRALENHVDVDLESMPALASPRRSSGGIGQALRPARISGASARCRSRPAPASASCTASLVPWPRPRLVASTARRAAPDRGHAENVGEVVLALGIVVQAQASAQPSAGAAIRPVLTSAPRAASRRHPSARRWRLHVAIGIEQHAAVAGRVVERVGEHGQLARCAPADRAGCPRVTKGTSPYSTSTRAVVGHVGKACCTACPVPSRSACSTQTRSPLAAKASRTCSPPWP